MLGLVIQALPLAVAPPELNRAGELVEAEFGFYLAACTAAVMEQKAIAIAGEHEGHIQRLGITQGLLHTGTNRVLVVLRLDHGDGQVGLVIQDEVGTAGFAPAVQLAPDDNAALGEADFLAHLLVQVPASLLDGWGDVLAADVPLGKQLFVHNPHFPFKPAWSIPAMLIVLDGRKCTLFGVDWG
ncbi:hypothetical protein D9M70_489560 [compost metagenome]